MPYCDGTVLEHRPAQQGLRLYFINVRVPDAKVLEHRPAQQGLRHGLSQVYGFGPERTRASSSTTRIKTTA